MADCDWAILCDHAFPDINRKMCLIGIFDTVNTARVPASLQSCTLAVKMIGDPNERVALRLEVQRPTGATLTEVSIEVVLDAKTGTAEIQLSLEGLPLPDVGDYAFNVFAGTALVRTVLIKVVLLSSETAPS